MPEDGSELDTRSTNHDNRAGYLRIQEKSVQKPEIPWDQWLTSLQDRFSHLTQVAESTDSEEVVWPPKMPNLPEQFKKIWSEIPNEYWADLAEGNRNLRKIKGESVTGIFYRPGIGYGGAIHEILEKIGTYGTMISSDPVYGGKEMDSWSDGLLPINYYVKSISLLEPQDMQVTLTGDYSTPGKAIDPKDYETAEIPLKGMATIDFKVNGVNLTLHILAQDMTKFSPEKYDILGLGRPTPYNHDKATDPRYSDNFKIQAIQNLAIGGIVDYHEEGFNFLPGVLPPEVFGFRVVKEEKGRKIVQKTEDTADKLKSAFEAVTSIHKALGALTGSLPGETWAGYYKTRNKHRGDEEEATIEDVINQYRKELESVAELITSLPDEELKNKTLKRIEFLFMNPISTDGQIDKEKIMKIHEMPEDPDVPEKRGYHPYFGNPSELIEDHNAGSMNIFNYYQELIDDFYKVFPQLRPNTQDAQ